MPIDAGRIRRLTTWSVPSENVPDKTYVVRYDDGDWTCTCPDHVYRAHPCKHVQAVQSLPSDLSCDERRCTYHTHYLVYGAPDLAHEAYHAAERKCAEAQRASLTHEAECKECFGGSLCAAGRSLDRAASRWEEMVRA